MDIKNVINFFAESLNHHSVYTVLIELLITLVATTLISKLVKKFLSKLREKIHKAGIVWESSIIKSIEKPLQFLIWMLGLTHIIILLNIFLKLELIKAIAAVRTVGVIVSILWFALSLIAEFEEYWSNGTASATSKLDKTTASALSKILRITAFVIAGLIVLETLGFSISGMLAFGGVGGIAVSFASKDMLANFFGALMIYLDKPFKVGDWIRIPEKDIEGYVEKIGLRCTVVRTLEKRPLYVPNSIFSIASIENPSRMSHRKISEEVALRHEDLHLIPKITEDINQMLKEHPSIDERQSIVVSLDNLAYASANIMVYAFTKAVETEDYYKVKHDIMLKIAAIIDKYEAKMSQNSYTLQLPDRSKSSAFKSGSKRVEKSKGAKKFAENDE